MSFSHSGPYNPLKIDVFSLGATVWEMAQAAPPFSDVQDVREITDTWPDLDEPEAWTDAFHEFLGLCSLTAEARPDPDELLDVRLHLFSIDCSKLMDLSQTPFVQSAADRASVMHLLSTCRAIEASAAEDDS